MWFSPILSDLSDLSKNTAPAESRVRSPLIAAGPLIVAESPSILPNVLTPESVVSNFTEPS